MTCRDVDEFLDSGPGSLVASPDVVAHMASCDDCRNLVSTLLHVEEHWQAPEIQIKRIQTRMIEGLKSIRPLPSSSFFLFLSAVVFISIVTTGATPFEMTGWAALSFLQRAGVFVTLAGTAMLLGISMIGQMTPGSKQVVDPFVLSIAIPAVLLFALVIAFRPQAETDFFGNGLACLKRGLTYGIPGAILFWLILRRGAILYPKIVGATAGGLAGLIGFAVLEVNCPNLNVFHILTWHWGLVVIGSLAGVKTGACAERVHRHNFSRSLANEE